VVDVFDAERSNHELWRDGYTLIPLLEAENIRAVQALHDEVFPAVPSDFYSSVMSATPEQRIRVLDGLRAIVMPKLATILPRHTVELASFMTKRPSSQRGRLPLHRDAWVADHRVQLAPSVWCPLVDVGPSNACLRMVRGSHHLLQSPCPMNALAVPAGHLTYQYDADPIEEEFIRDVPVAAGTAVVYDPRVLHASGENRTDQTRVAFNCLTVPVGQRASVYWWDDRPPGRMEAFEVTASFLCESRYGTRPDVPYPEGVRLSETFDVPRTPIRIDRARLKQLQAVA
jgi:hypothetical protein